LTILKNKTCSSIDENYLWEQLLDGNICSLEEVMQFYFRTLFCYGSKFTTDKELVKDSIQELFIGIWERRSYLSRIVNLKAYLFSSLRRLILKRKLSDRYSVVPFNEEEINNFDFELSIEENLIESEQAKIKAQKVLQWVSILPRRQKEIIYLKFFHNLNRDEIAEILHINSQTVSNHLQMAFKSMRSNKELISLIMFLLICIFQTY
jgi:RNA polymerase sigma factor (sigma-70 family)